MRVRFKGLLLFTALTAPAGLAIAQTGVPGAPQAARRAATAGTANA